MKTYLLNPFVKLAGTKALLIGLAMILIVAVLTLISPGHFDGVLDYHPININNRSWTKLILISITENVINVLTLGIVFSISALLFVGMRFRLIDVFGTMAYARFPLYIASLVNIGGFYGALNLKLATSAQNSGFPDLDTSGWITLLAGILILIPCIVWFISLLYKAYTVSSGLKGTKATVSFIIALLLAEIVSKYIHHAIIPSLL